jgi:hypothetical protein
MESDHVTMAEFPLVPVHGATPISMDEGRARDQSSVSFITINDANRQDYVAF